MTLLESSRSFRQPSGFTDRGYRFYLAVAVVQGVHVVEHIIQLIQVLVLHVPDEKALGLLGYVFQFNGTEEWLHVVFNYSYLAALYVLLVMVYRSHMASVIPVWAFRTFLFAGVGLETWHAVEHTVIIYHVIKNHGCPCPGIGDQALMVSDTYLHFGYNVVAYLGTMAPFIFVQRSYRSAASNDLAVG
jgi:hypothetical protein